MAPFYVFFAFLLQVSLINSENTTTSPVYDDTYFETSPISIDGEYSSYQANIESPDCEYELVDNFDYGSKDFYDVLFGSHGTFTGNSAKMMEEVTKNKDISQEQQVEEIKRAAQKISACIESELLNFLSFIRPEIEKASDDCKNRKKRSTDSGMDMAKLVMRLLNHIKSTNECQNEAIEKMMSAEEIATKFGIDYHPDAEEINELVKACEAKESFDFENEVEPDDEVETINPHYYHYDSSDDGMTNAVHEVHVPPQHLHPAPQIYYSFEPHYETQVRPPPAHHHHVSQPVSHRPAVFYEQPSYTPAPQFHPHTQCNDAIIEFELEPIDLEPELVGEEYEEIISSKVTVDKGEEPGTATVNHVMTYTLSEKSHFKKPEIEQLPEQVQYSFYLI